LPVKEIQLLLESCPIGAHTSDVRYYVADKNQKVSKQESKKHSSEIASQKSWMVTFDDYGQMKVFLKKLADKYPRAF
jgi:hypothetical protein